MLRGEFIRADGLVIPNNITSWGAARILRAAMLNVDSEWWVALVNVVPEQDLQIEDLNEPTIGVNGYERIEILRSIVGWPAEGTLNGEFYVESGFLTWEAVGGDFDAAVTRMAILTSETDTDGEEVVCLSGAFPAELTVTPETAEADRKFKYRIYLR